MSLMATSRCRFLVSVAPVDGAEAAHLEELVEAIAAVQQRAAGDGQRVAAALAVALAGRIGDAAGGVGAQVRRTLGLGGAVGLQHEAAVHARDGAFEPWRAARGALGRRGESTSSGGARCGGVGAATPPLADGTGAAGAAAGAAAGCRFGTANGFLHDGHCTCLPDALSGICIDLVQCGQRITNAMGGCPGAKPVYVYAPAHGEQALNVNGLGYLFLR